MLGVIAALVVLACTFQWSWCRPLIRHYVMSHSGRDIRFDDLQVHWRDGLDPTIEFRGLTIENAPWAASRQPFIHAGRIAATLSWRSLGSDLVIVNMIEMEDAQLDIEQRADGVRNWRLGHPDDTGPPHARVLALDARRSTLHTVHGGIGLELDATTTPLGAQETLPTRAALPLTKRIAFAGTIEGHAFDGEARTSDVLTFGGAPRMFSLRATARVGTLRLTAAGLCDDAHALGDLDLDATIATEGSGAPWPLPEAVARLRPLMARGRVIKIGDQWNADDLRLAAGRHTSLAADVAFTGTFKSDTPRRTLKATLREAVVDLDDLSLLRGKTPPGEKTLPQTRPDADHALSNQPLPLARLREAMLFAVHHAAEPLDSAALVAHLEQTDSADTAAVVLSGRPMPLPAYARTVAMPAEAEAGFWEIFGLMHQASLQADIAAAGQAFTQNPNAETQARLIALTEALDQLTETQSTD